MSRVEAVQHTVLRVGGEFTKITQLSLAITRRDPQSLVRNNVTGLPVNATISMHKDFPVGTAIAGNILHNFRVEIDYPHGMTCLKQSSHPGSNDIDSAGIIFRAATDGTYYVAGIATKNDGFTQCSSRWTD